MGGREEREEEDQNWLYDMELLPSFLLLLNNPLLKRIPSGRKNKKDNFFY